MSFLREQVLLQVLSKEIVPYGNFVQTTYLYSFLQSTQSTKLSSANISGVLNTVTWGIKFHLVEKSLKS